MWGALKRTTVMELYSRLLVAVLIAILFSAGAIGKSTAAFVSIPLCLVLMPVLYRVIYRRW